MITNQVSRPSLIVDLLMPHRKYFFKILPGVSSPPGGIIYRRHWSILGCGMNSDLFIWDTQSILKHHCTVYPYLIFHATNSNRSPTCNTFNTSIRIASQHNPQTIFISTNAIILTSTQHNFARGRQPKDIHMHRILVFAVSCEL